MPRDQAAELLSIVRSAYKAGYQAAVGTPAPLDSELLHARAEAKAIDYVQIREENPRHPLAILVAQLTSQYVLASDYDALQAKLTAAERELATTKATFADRVRVIEMQLEDKATLTRQLGEAMETPWVPADKAGEQS